MGLEAAIAAGLVGAGMSAGSAGTAAAIATPAIYGAGIGSVTNAAVSAGRGEEVGEVFKSAGIGAGMGAATGGLIGAGGVAVGGATPAPPPPGTEQTVTQSADFGANAVAQGTGQTAQTTTTEAASQTLTQQAGQFARDAAPALAAGGVTTGLSMALAPTPEMPSAPDQPSGAGLAARDRERRRRAQSSRSTIRSTLGSAMGARTGRATLGGGY